MRDRYLTFFFGWGLLVASAAALGAAALPALDAKLALDASRRQEAFVGYRTAWMEAGR